MYCKGLELKKKYKQARAENNEPSWTASPVRWNSGIRAESGLTGSAHLSPRVLLSDSAGMTLPLPCIPCMTWSLVLFSLVTGLDLLNGNTIPCPHKHSSCVVLRQNIHAERSPNTARLSGGKSEILHHGSLMVWIDSEPHQSCILTLWNSECLKKTVQRKVCGIWIWKYIHICWYLKQPGICTESGKSITYSSKKCYFSRDSTAPGNLEFRFLYSHLSFACTLESLNVSHTHKMAVIGGDFNSNTALA